MSHARGHDHGGEVSTCAAALVPSVQDAVETTPRLRRQEGSPRTFPSKNKRLPWTGAAVGAPSTIPAAGPR